MRRQALQLVPRLLSGGKAGAAFPALSAAARRSFADDASLKKTALYDFHVEHGGTIVFPIYLIFSLLQDQIKTPSGFSHCRQDGAVCWLEYANPVC